MSKEKRVKNPDNKLGLGKLLLWSTSSVSVAISALVLGFVTVYCTDTLGLSPVIVGTVLLFSKLIDGVTDMVAGVIIDKTQTRWGKGRPYEIFMLFLWLSTWGLFSVPTHFSTMAKYIWIFFMYVFMDAVCTTFLNGNNVVYLVRAFKTKEQQTKLTAYSGFFTMGAGFAFNILFPMGVARIATSAAGWSRLIGMMALPLTVLGLVRMLTIKEQYNMEADVKSEQLKIMDVVNLFKTNAPAVKIGIVRFLAATISSMGVGVYYFSHVVGNVALMSVTAAFTVIGIPLAFVMPVMRRKMGQDKMVTLGFILCLIGSVIMLIAGKNFVLVLIAGLFTSIGAVPFSMMFNMYIIDCADYNEMLGNQRMEGTMGAVFGLMAKIGGAFGGFVLGAILSLVGYDGTLAVQPASSIMAIRILASVVPFIFYVVIILILRQVKLDEKVRDFSHEKAAEEIGREA
jgi:Na+/melibiose symporter-like transporter